MKYIEINQLNEQAIYNNYQIHKTPNFHGKINKIMQYTNYNFKISHKKGIKNE